MWLFQLENGMERNPANWRPHSPPIAAHRPGQPGMSSHSQGDIGRDIGQLHAQSGQVAEWVRDVLYIPA